MWVRKLPGNSRYLSFEMSRPEHDLEFRPTIPVISVFRYRQYTQNRNVYNPLTGYLLRGQSGVG